MRDRDKEFDSYIRSMLENAEEQAPSHILDGIFCRMDEEAEKSRRRPAFPLWLKRGGIACAAAAAAVAVAIVMWPDGGGMQPTTPEMIAEVSAGGLPGGGSDAEPGVNNVGDDAEGETIVVSVQQTSSTCGKRSYIAALLPSDADEPSYAGRTEAGVSEADASESDASAASESAADTDISAGTAAEADAEASAVISAAGDEDTGSEAGSDDSQEEIPFGDWEERRSASPKVSMVVGGDVTSNGDPSGLRRSGGFKAPAVKYTDGVRISQTSSESSYSIPVSVGVGVKIAFTEHWAIGTGVNYSLLQRTFSGKYTKVENGVIVKSITSDIKHQLHYIGIPLNVYYNLIDSDKIKLYTYAGATAEKGILNAYRIKDASKYLAHKENVKGVQLSAGAGFGVEFMIVDQVGFYLDPGFRYYFDCDQPVNIRTQQPFMMSFEAGLRVAL